MRLIDADDFKEFLINLCEAGAPYDGVIESLDKQPTSYDVDNVVERLEDRSKEYNSGIRLHGKPEEIITNEVIEIVKGGGKE